MFNIKLESDALNTHEYHNLSAIDKATLLGIVLLQGCKAQQFTKSAIAFALRSDIDNSVDRLVKAGFLVMNDQQILLSPSFCAKKVDPTLKERQSRYRQKNAKPKPITAAVIEAAKNTVELAKQSIIVSNDFSTEVALNDTCESIDMFVDLIEATPANINPILCDSKDVDGFELSAIYDFWDLETPAKTSTQVSDDVFRKTSKVKRELSDDEKLEEIRRKEKQVVDKALRQIGRVELPSFVDPEIFDNFLRMRALNKRAVNSKFAVDAVVRQLISSHEKGHDVNAMLDRATSSNWVTVYEPNQKPGQVKLHPANQNRPRSGVAL